MILKRHLILSLILLKVTAVMDAKEDFDQELSARSDNSLRLVCGHTQGRKSPRKELLQNRLEIRQMALNLSMCQNHLEGFIEQCPRPQPPREFLIQQIWNEALEFTFLRFPPSVVLMLLIQIEFEKLAQLRGSGQAVRCVICIEKG